MSGRSSFFCVSVTCSVFFLYFGRKMRKEEIEEKGKEKKVIFFPS